MARLCLRPERPRRDPHRCGRRLRIGASLTDIDALKSSFIWSPDSKSLAFTTSDNKLYTVSLEGKASRSWRRRTTARSAARHGRPTASGSPIPGRRDAVERRLPDPGRRWRGEEDLVRLGRRGEPPVLGGRQEGLLRPRRERSAARRARTQLFCVPLERLDKDPEEPEPRPDDEAERGPAGRAAGDGGRAAGTPERPKIDWAGLKRRTRQVTRPARCSTISRPATAGR